MFEPSSRYARIAEAEIEGGDGRRIIYKLRRFLPDPASVQVSSEVVVGQGDRLDRIAARAYGNPEVFWQIADASNALDPFTLDEEPGRILIVPVPEP